MDLIDEVKVINGIVDDKHDKYLSVIVPMLEEYVKDECNNLFKKRGKTILPGAVRLFIAKAAKHNMGNNVKSKKMGTVSYSYDLDFPSAITDMLRPYKRVRFHAF